MQVTTVGVDLAKRVFQAHGVNTQGQVVVRKRLSRAQLKAYFSALPPALVGMEACASGHYWARVLGSYGHQVRLIPPQWVKPYLKGNKNDGNDAAVICEAVGRVSVHGMDRGLLQKPLAEGGPNRSLWSHV
jgi:transposase